MQKFLPLFVVLVLVSLVITQHVRVDLSKSRAADPRCQNWVCNDPNDSSCVEAARQAGCDSYTGLDDNGRPGPISIPATPPGSGNPGGNALPDPCLAGGTNDFGQSCDNIKNKCPTAGKHDFCAPDGTVVHQAPVPGINDLSAWCLVNGANDQACKDLAAKLDNKDSPGHLNCAKQPQQCQEVIKQYCHTHQSDPFCNLPTAGAIGAEGNQPINPNDYCAKFSNDGACMAAPDCKPGGNAAACDRELARVCATATNLELCRSRGGGTPSGGTGGGVCSTLTGADKTNCEDRIKSCASQSYNRNLYAQCLGYWYEGGADNLCFAGPNGQNDQGHDGTGRPCSCSGNPTYQAGSNDCLVYGGYGGSPCGSGQSTSQPTCDVVQCIDVFTGKIVGPSHPVACGGASSDGGTPPGSIPTPTLPNNCPPGVNPPPGGRCGILGWTPTPTPRPTPTPTPTATPTPAPLPKISTFAPLAAKLGATVMVKGSNFVVGGCPTGLGAPDRVTSVLIGGQTVTVADSSATALTFRVPDGLDPGAYKLQVVSGGCATRAGRASDYSSRLLSVISSTGDPTVYYVVPLKLARNKVTTVTVYGTNLDEVVNVFPDSDELNVNTDSLVTAQLAGGKVRVRFTLSVSASVATGLQYLMLEDDAGNTIRFAVVVQ